MHLTLERIRPRRNSSRPTPPDVPPPPKKQICTNLQRTREHRRVDAIAERVALHGDDDARHAGGGRRADRRRRHKPIDGQAVVLHQRRCRRGRRRAEAVMVQLFQLVDQIDDLNKKIGRCCCCLSRSRKLSLLLLRNLPIERQHEICTNKE
jgi:hypothetical protein